MKVYARLAFASMLMVLAAAPANAGITLSDLWFNRNESGWGANIIQQENIVFVTVFVYGSDNRPTWFVAPATVLDSATARYTGPLYITNGPTYAGTFNPSAVGNRQVGTLTVDLGCSGCNFTNNVRLSYTVDGVSVTKTVERQTWQTVNIRPAGFGAIKVIAGSTCAGYPTGPSLVAWTYAGGTFTITDTNGVRYTANISGLAQYGTLFSGLAPVTISGSPALGGTGVNLNVVNGQFSMQLTGIGAGNCIQAYTVIGAPS